MHADVDFMPLHSRGSYGAPQGVFHPAVQVLAYSKGPSVEGYPAVPVRNRLRKFLRDIPAGLPVEALRQLTVRQKTLLPQEGSLFMEVPVQALVPDQGP